MKMMVDNFDWIKEQFLLDIQTAVKMEDILPELVFNWDQTGISIVTGIILDDGAEKDQNS